MAVRVDDVEVLASGIIIFDGKPKITIDAGDWQVVLDFSQDTNPSQTSYVPGSKTLTNFASVKCEYSGFGISNEGDGIFVKTFIDKAFASFRINYTITRNNQ
jgi:hypothetical protein